MRPFLIAALFLSVAAPAYAATTCADDIKTIERRLNSPGAAAVTGETTGPIKQGSDEAAKEAPTPQTGSVAPSTEAGVDEARKLIEQAKTYDRNGNKAACVDAMTKAKTKIGALP